jgi:hypothetical protein
MWEELKDWVRNKRDVLKELGWENDSDLEEPSIRRKFDTLLKRYQGWVPRLAHFSIGSWSAYPFPDQRYAYSNILLVLVDGIGMGFTIKGAAVKGGAYRRGENA